MEDEEPTVYSTGASRREPTGGLLDVPCETKPLGARELTVPAWSFQDGLTS